MIALFLEKKNVKFRVKSNPKFEQFLRKKKEKIYK